MTNFPHHHTTTTDATAPSVIERIRAALADVSYANRRIFEIQAGVRISR